MNSQLEKEMCDRYLLTIVRNYFGFDRDDFLGNFYIEALVNIRKERYYSSYVPKSKLEVTEYLEFVRSYAKRKVDVGRRKIEIIKLRVITLIGKASHKYQHVEYVDTYDWSHDPSSQLFDLIDLQDLLNKTIQRIKYKNNRYRPETCDEKQSQETLEWLKLKLLNCSAGEINETMDIDSRHHDYIQQRFKYNLKKVRQSEKLISIALKI